MGYLSLVHLRDLRCDHCKALIGQAGARSFIVDGSGNPLLFSTDDPPAEMAVQLTCPNGHAVELNVPNEIAAEETLTTPDEAPIAADAVVVSGMTEKGEELP